METKKVESIIYSFANLMLFVGLVTTFVLIGVSIKNENNIFLFAIFGMLFVITPTWAVMRLLCKISENINELNEKQNTNKQNN